MFTQEQIDMVVKEYAHLETLRGRNVKRVNSVAEWLIQNYVKAEVFNIFTTAKITYTAEKYLDVVFNEDIVVASLLLGYTMKDKANVDANFNFLPKPPLYDNPYLRFLQSKKWRHKNLDFVTDVFFDVKLHPYLQTYWIEDWTNYFKGKQWFIYDIFKYTKSCYNKSMLSWV